MFSFRYKVPVSRWRLQMVLLQRGSGICICFMGIKPRGTQCWGHRHHRVSTFGSHCFSQCLTQCLHASPLGFPSCFEHSCQTSIWTFKPVWNRALRLPFSSQLTTKVCQKIDVLYCLYNPLMSATGMRGHWVNSNTNPDVEPVIYFSVLNSAIHFWGVVMWSYVACTITQSHVLLDVERPGHVWTASGQLGVLCNKWQQLAWLSQMFAWINT
jgi:hypothetical protein